MDMPIPSLSCLIIKCLPYNFFCTILAMNIFNSYRVITLKHEVHGKFNLELCYIEYRQFANFL